MHAILTRYARFSAVCAFAVFLISSCSADKEPRLPSASENVRVLAQQFTITELKRDRKIRLYLPPDYDTENKRYPVLYMHDGQNLFDDATSYAGEWAVDETLNNLYRDKGLALIVVGIDNGEHKRMSELSPWENDQIDGVEGEQYMNFIVKQVKPFIDTNYRTLSDAHNTAIMGSSMGGLISHYAIFQYPDTFSKAGIFSPSYWVSDEIYRFTNIDKLTSDSQLYLIVGDDEGYGVVEKFEKMTQYLSNKGLKGNQLKSKVVTGGEHNEAFWRGEFANAVLWLFNY